MMLKKIGIGFFILLGATVVSILVARTVIGQKNEPLRSCLAEFEQAKQTYVRLAHHEGKEIDYYVYSVGRMSEVTYWEPLIEVQSGVCRVLNANRDDSDHPLSEYVEPAIAKKLVTSVIERKFKALGGQKKFEATLAEEAKASKKPLLMPRENYEALKSLGVKIPANVKPFDGVPEPSQVEVETR